MTDRARMRALLAEHHRRRELRWCPHTPEPKQAEFLELDCLEALYGGAAGGGKSNALLMAALQFVDVPGYSAILFRKTYADLSKAGALMDRAAEWLAPTAARWNEQKKQWRFPSGAVLSFGHMETDKDRFEYQSTEYQFIGWDELTHWPTPAPYRFMFTRHRRLVTSTIPLRVRAATNPGGLGHDWVAKYFGMRIDGTQDEELARLDPETGERGELRVFVPAKLADNRHVDADAYRKTLKRVDTITRQQQEDGLWVRDSGGLIYPIRAHNLCDSFPDPVDRYGRRVGGWIFVLAIDLGAGQAKPSTSFAVLAYHPEKPVVYVVQSELLAGMTPTKIATRIRALEEQFGGFESIVVDEGALGKGYGDEFREHHQIPTKPADKKNKLGFRKNLRGALEREEPVEVLIVEPQNEELIAECGRVEWNDKGTDVLEGLACHLSDALLYGWRACKPHLHEPPDTRPEPGTADALDAWAAELKQREIDAASRRGKRRWWAK